MRSIGLPELFVLAVTFMFVCFTIWPFWRIFTKAGYPGVMGILMAIPLLNVIMAFFLAFSEWPVLRELEALRQRVPPPLQ